MGRATQFQRHQIPMLLRLALVLGVGLSLLTICSADTRSQHLTGRLVDRGEKHLRSCSVADLLPLPAKEKSPEWSDELVIDFPYNCTCPAMKGRYFCPSQDSPAYPRWEPTAEGQGLCKSATISDMSAGPFPPNFKILLYGNSHIRQVVESIMCMFPDGIESKRVTFGIPKKVVMVSSDKQCRTCTPAGDPNNQYFKDATLLQKSLLANGCIAEEADSRCDDNRGQFFFKNGAVVHYKFSDHQKKNLYDATKDHGKDQLSSYDAVFMNPGNDTPMTPEDAIGSATKVQAAGTPFFWLSTFIGVGSMTDWSDDQRSRFFASGARYLDIESMAQGMIAWNRGAIEGVTDSHFCLPGPPNEMALLVLKIIWAVNEENMDP